MAIDFRDVQDAQPNNDSNGHVSTIPFFSGRSLRKENVCKFLLVGMIFGAKGSTCGPGGDQTPIMA